MLILYFYVQFGTSLLHIQKTDLLCDSVQLYCMGNPSTEGFRPGSCSCCRGPAIRRGKICNSESSSCAEEEPSAQECASQVHAACSTGSLAEMQDVQKGRPKLHIGLLFQCSFSISMCNLERPFCTSDNPAGAIWNVPFAHLAWGGFCTFFCMVRCPIGGSDGGKRR